MRADARALAASAALAATLASIGYAAFALSRVRAFGRTLRVPPRPARRPPILVLKPVHGLEPRLEENLRSFCAQDYPDYRVVLGVRSANDPALPLLRRLAAESPERVGVVVGEDAARLVEDGRASPVFRNPKIATVAPMLAHADAQAAQHGAPERDERECYERACYEHECGKRDRDDAIVVIADSDMRVTARYLDAVAEAFDDPRAGAATAIYRGEPAGGDLASALGAMWITEQFAPSALVSAALEPLGHTFGATMAVRRTVLAEIGGLAALGDRLADDHALGRLVAARGHRVALARCVVTNVVAEPGLAALVRHELRWARTIRTVRRAGYAGIALTYPVPLAVLHLALARDRTRALAVLTLAALVRAVLGRTARRTLVTYGECNPENRPLAVRPWHTALRDLLGVGVWALGLRGGAVRWRDDALDVGADGALRPREAPPSA
ncbi:MAG TPA: glycosyltransferase [Candidatus Elarobacter sp.]|nr:glycosyltransferase [Candidatus Elarobacter sp.]